MMTVLGMVQTTHPASNDLPALGDASTQYLTPLQEEFIGRVFRMNLRRTAPLINDRIVVYETQKHLTSIGQYAGLKDVDLTIFVMDNNDLNAFAVPGGVIGINMGLILAAEDIHQYTSVIAHELAHLSQKHHARRVEEQSGLGVRNLVGLIASLAMIAGGGTDAALATMMGTQALVQGLALSYSRAQEREADRVGFNTLVEAGYDPLGSTRMFETMQQKYRYQRKPPEYLSTHPITSNRIADTRAKAVGESSGKSYKSSDTYMALRARLEIREIRNPENAVAVARLGEPGYRLAFALSRNGDHQEACQMMEEIVSTHPANLIFIGSYIEMLLNAERAQAALTEVNQHLLIYPENDLLIWFKATALEKLERYGEAKQTLEQHTRKVNDDHTLWFRLAEVANLDDDLLLAHRARAEYHALRGEFGSAIRQLHQAKQLAHEDDFRLNASIDQRMLDLRDDAERFSVQ